MGAGSKCGLVWRDPPSLAPLPFPSLPLEVGPLIAARWSGGALQAPPAGSGAEPRPPTHFGHVLSPGDAILRTILVHVVCTRLSQFKQICLTDKRTLITCNNAVSIGLRNKE